MAYVKTSDDEVPKEEDNEVRWCHPTKQVRVCRYRSILSIVWWGEIILIIYAFCEDVGEPTVGRYGGRVVQSDAW